MTYSASHGRAIKPFVLWLSCSSVAAAVTSIYTTRNFAMKMPSNREMPTFYILLPDSKCSVIQVVVVKEVKYKLKSSTNNGVCSRINDRARLCTRTLQARRKQHQSRCQPQFQLTAAHTPSHMHAFYKGLRCVQAPQ